MSNQTMPYKNEYNRIFPSKISTTTFLTLYVLYLFSDGRVFYGKQLVDEISSKFKGNWKPSHGIVYPTLRKLEEQKLLEGAWEDADDDKKTKRLYKITPLGKKTFKKELENNYKMFADSYNMLVQILHDLYKDEYVAIDNIK